MIGWRGLEGGCTEEGLEGGLEGSKGGLECWVEDMGITGLVGTCGRGLEGGSEGSKFESNTEGTCSRALHWLVQVGRRIERF